MFEWYKRRLQNSGGRQAPVSSPPDGDSAADSAQTHGTIENSTQSFTMTNEVQTLSKSASAGGFAPAVNPPDPNIIAPAGGGSRFSWTKVAWILGLGTAGSAALVGATYPLSGLLIRPRLKRLSQLKSPHVKTMIRRLGIQVEDVSFSSFDSTRLNGWWMEANPGGPTVVILHGVKQNRTDVIRTAIVLGRAGFNILVFDGRGHGNSGGRYVTYGFYEKRDADSVLKWLTEEKKVKPGLIGIAGESMGAAIALQVAASNPSVSAVWADSPFSSLRRIAEEYVRKVTHLPDVVLSPVLWTTIKMANYRGKFDIELVNPLSVAASINCPVYMVHGTADQLISPEHSQHIFGALTGTKEMWLVEGARHARAVRHSRQEYSDRITGFFRKFLADPKQAA